MSGSLRKKENIWYNLEYLFFKREVAEMMEEQLTHSSSIRHKKFLHEIEEWLLEYTSTNDDLIQDFIEMKKEEVNKSFSTWIRQLPEQQKQTFLEVLDQLIFQLSSYYHKSSRCNELEQKIMVEGRLFYSELDSITDMSQVPFHQLEYIEEKFKSKYRLYALMEGGIAGIGNPLSIALDFPALLFINLNLIQHIAGTYGYSLRSTGEQMLALKVLYASTLPRNYRHESWEWVTEQIKNKNDYDILISDEESMIQPEWLETLAKQWLKSVALLGLRKSSKKGIPILGVLLGANVNYHFTKNAAQFASYFYRYRFLYENFEVQMD